MTIFETNRLVVRKYDFDLDSENFFIMNSDEEIMQYIRPPKSREECDIFLKEIITHAETNPGMGRWAAVEKDTGRFVGSFAIIPIENTDLIQLGYSLMKNEWGKGYATELTKGGLDFYFRSTTADHIYGVTETPNVASQKVLMKNGFVKDSVSKEGEKELIRFIHRKS